MKIKKEKKLSEQQNIVINVNNNDNSDKKKDDKNYDKVFQLMIQVAGILLNKLIS